MKTGEDIKSFFDLTAWQRGHDLALEVYRLTKTFPPEEKFGITSQLRRAASSVTANIAEGWARYHFKDKTRFYYQARGSWSETQNFLVLAKDLHYIDQQVFSHVFAQTQEVGQLLNGLIRSIQKLSQSSNPNTQSQIPNT